MKKLNKKNKKNLVRFAFSVLILAARTKELIVCLANAVSLIFKLKEG